MLAGALCAVTTTLRFNFFVLKLPIRPPALVAKQAGSLAAMFGNRLGLGVGTSPWPEDYELMGVPFARRGKRMDECIDDHPRADVRRVLRVSRRVLRHPEDQDDARAHQADPDPGRRPRRRRAAPRRAQRRLDAWRRRRAGGTRRAPVAAQAVSARREGNTGPFEIHVISMDASAVDGIKRLEDKGVTDVIVGFRIPYIMGRDTAAAGGQDPPPGEVRREGHGEGERLAFVARNQVTCTETGDFRAGNLDFGPTSDQTAAAAARPATRPENRQPPRNVPSSAL